MHISQPVHAMVVQKITDTIADLAAVYDVTIPMPSVAYDAAGRTLALADSESWSITFNAPFLLTHLNLYLSDIIAHECAHLFVWYVFHDRDTEDHGTEWRTVMRTLGLMPRAQYNVDYSAVEHVRHETKHLYTCACTRHVLSQRSHNRIQQGLKRVCVECSEYLNYASPLGKIPFNTTDTNETEPHPTGH